MSPGHDLREVIHVPPWAAALAAAAVYAPLFWLLRPFTPASVADASAILRVALRRAVIRSG